LEILNLLHSKYKVLIEKQTSLAKLELHTDDLAFDLPDLYVEVVPKDTLPYWMLAEALDIIQTVEDPVTGEPLIVARIGKAMPLRLGKAMQEALEDVSHTSFLAIKGEADQRLNLDYAHKDEKNKLREKLEGGLDAVRLSLKGGDLNPEYAKYYQAFNKAEKILGVG
jgi:hypothetical protein